MVVKCSRLTPVRIAGIAGFIVLNLLGVLVQAQTAVGILSTESHQVPEWQRAAGGKLSFEVASIKPGDPATFTPPNFALDDLDTFGGADPRGRLVASFDLLSYVLFAYKLPYHRELTESLVATLPKWFSTDSYVINAQAEGDPTKDQMRLMMQSLLADRFKLAVHFERKELPALALVLDKPGKTGPKLYLHSKGLPCDALPANSTDVFPPFCDRALARDKPNRIILMGARNVTMAQIAAILSTAGRLPHFVVDRTGLDGPFDFTLEWTNQSVDVVAPQEAQLLLGASYQEALQEQLGLKLQSTKVSVDILVVDHVERPSEN
jgi:uncharacterized protein (TIGR03435 family)